MVPRHIFAAHSPSYGLAEPFFSPLSEDIAYTAFLKIPFLLLINKHLLFMILQKMLKIWPRDTKIWSISNESKSFGVFYANITNFRYLLLAWVTFSKCILTKTIETGINFYYAGLEQYQNVEQIHNLVPYEGKKRKKKAWNNSSWLCLLLVNYVLWLHSCHYSKTLNL